MFKRLLVSAFLLSSSSAYAAEFIVPPGINTIQPVIDSAAEGDVIILQTGTYDVPTYPNEININKSLTIKAESASAQPSIDGNFKVLTETAFSKLTIQGVAVKAINISGSVDEVELLNVDLTYSGSSTSAQTKKFTMVGSSLCGHTSTSLIAHAGDMVIAGNTFCQNPHFYSSNIGSQSISVIGNSFTSTTPSSLMRIDSYGSSVLIAGNRFTQNWAISTETYTPFNYAYAFIELPYAGPAYNIRNNIFVANTARLDQSGVDDEFNSIRPTNRLEGVYFENNLVDAGNIKMWVPTAPEVEQAGMIEIGTQIPKSIKGNIFINFEDNIFPSAATGKDIGAQNNLCFNNGTVALPTDCGTTDGNLNVDPLFTDTINYQLGSTSPAIDAGPVDAVLSDIDGTRNDMGPYGGSWSIDKFDAQREAGAVGPYIYPVIDASKSVANGNVQVKFISYGRQL